MSGSNPPPDTSGQLTDPFNFAQANSNAPGLFGQTQGFWRDMAQMGANISSGANARDARGFLVNPGFGGAAASGIGQTYENGRQNALTRSNLESQHAATQGTQIENAFKPQLLNSLLATQGAGLQGVQIENLLKSLGIAPATARAGLQTNIINGMNGGGPTGNIPRVTGNAIPPEQRQPMLAQATAGTQIPPTLLHALADQESSWDPTARNQSSGAFGLTGALPSTAANPGFNVPPLAQNASPQDQLTWGAHYLQARGQQAGVTNWSDPNQVTKALIAFHGPRADANGMDGPTYAANILRRAMGGVPATRTPGGGAPPQAAPAQAAPPPAAPVQAPAAGVPHAQVPGSFQVAQAGGTPVPAPAQAPAAGGQPAPVQLPAGMSPQEARKQSDFYAQQAIRMQAAGLDATPYTQRASQLNEYANQYDLQQSKPTTLRGEGSGLISPSGVIQSPLRYKILGPDNRQYEITQNSIETGQPYTRPEGVPEWAPAGSLSVVPSDLGPGEHEAQKAASEDAFGEKARAQYASSQGTLRAMEDMEHQFNQLNQTPGWYNSGAGAEWKLSLGKTINGIAQSTGAPPIFDPDKLASGEDLVKQSKLAGMQVLATMFGGSREAASIIHSTQAAVPNIENTPQGGMLVLNSIKEASRWQSDQHAFMANWYNEHKGNMIGADVAFAQARPSNMYARRGISQVKPFEISGPKEMSRYLPGTRVILKGGDPNDVRTIPGEDDVTMPVQAPAPQGGPPNGG